MNWYIEKKIRGRQPGWKRVAAFTDQFTAEQQFFRYHYSIGRISNEDGTVIISVPYGEEKEN